MMRFFFLPTLCLATFRKRPSFLALQIPRGGVEERQYGRINEDEFLLTSEQIETFHNEGCITIENVLTEEEVVALEIIFDRFMAGEIPVPDKDFCDMSKPFGIPRDQWSIVNCMLPTTYYPEWAENVYERVTASIVRQLFPNEAMSKDYDQLLNKLPGKSDAIFAWHQDMGYWPSSAALNVNSSSTATFSLAVDDSTEENGCLRYMVHSGVLNTLRAHAPLVGESRDEGHALTLDVQEDDVIQLAPAKRGSITIHDEYVVHGSSGNNSSGQRRTYVLAYRAKAIVDAERRIGFSHSHNDDVNWDTFHNGES